MILEWIEQNPILVLDGLLVVLWLYLFGLDHIRRFIHEPTVLLERDGDPTIRYIYAPYHDPELAHYSITDNEIVMSFDSFPEKAGATRVYLELYYLHELSHWAHDGQGHPTRPMGNHSKRWNPFLLREIAWVHGDIYEEQDGKYTYAVLSNDVEVTA